MSIRCADCVAVVLSRRFYRLRLHAIAIASTCLFALTTTATPTPAADRTWIGGNANWVDGGATANWNPADEPDSDDTAIFNTANAVILGSNNSILALTMSGGIDLNTNNFDLDVNGLVQLTGASTNLFVGAADSLLTADSITINSGANLEINGGAIQINEEAGNGLLDINAGGELIGHGTLSMTDAVAANTTLIVNDGAITARRAPLLIFGAPQIGTLTLSATDVDTRIDLDGASESGVVNVTRNQTLDLNIQMTDAFSGTINLFQDATLNVSNAWGLNSGTINADNGLVDNPAPNPDIPAGISTIGGATFTQSGGTINVVDTDGTLVLPARFNMTGGTFNNQGHTIINGIANIETTATFNMGPSGSDLTIGPDAIANIDQNSFNLDGNLAGTVITVQEGGALNLNLGDYDNDSATNSFDATITLNSGDISVTTADAEFIMNGVLNMANTSGPAPTWSGEPLDIGNDLGPLSADLNVSGAGNSDFVSPVDFNSDADVNVPAGSTLRFLSGSTVNFNTVNGANNAEFTGAGTISFSAAVNVNEAATLNMVGGTIDLDGVDAVGDFINIDAPLTINAATMSSFGKINGGGGTNTLDINNSVGTGVLTVNLDDANAEWTLNAAGVMNLVNDNTEATLLAGSDVNLNGTVNVTGDVRVAARVDIGGGTVNINTAAQPLRLSGGNNSNEPNTIAGGTITGAGLLGADDDTALHGFGTINTGVDFDAASNLFADGGTLTINGAIVDVSRIGTFDADGVLNVVNPWDTSVASFVTLEGGTLQGGTMTINNNNGVSGFGSITARVVNNVRLRSSDGTLVVETAGNDNDWDGAAGSGRLTAINSGTLELRDVGAAFGFLGIAEASSGGRIFTNGFALDFNPGSTLSLASGGKYQSNRSTDLGGTVTVGAGGATIEVQNNSFLTFETGSATTLGSNLHLVNNNINIEAGATFSGAGALIVLEGSHVAADNLADVGVLLDMQGAFRPGNSEGIGRVNLFDYQQGSTGELFVELRGTALNAFDRLVASGDVTLDGYLNIDIDAVSPGVPFVPVLGQTFNIITGNSVTGEFDFADVSGMPAGLAFHVEYLANAVQLQVVTKPIFSADFDEDGDVDMTDLAIWEGAFNLNQLGDANGDNRTDIDDWTIWRDQLGAAPAPPENVAVPEPTSLVLVASALAALALLRRSSGKKRVHGAVVGALLCAGGMTGLLPATATAAPIMSVTDNGLLGGNRQWLVQVAPDPALLGTRGSLAVELGFEVTVGELLSATVNTSAWPFNLPANHSPPEFGASEDGLNVNTMSDTVFAALGSDPFNNANLVPVLTIVTEGAGATTLTWGGYDVVLSGGGGGFVVTGARIAQAGIDFNGFQGSLSAGGTPGDSWDNSSGSGLWSDAVNWADDTEPTAAGVVTFPVGFPNGDTVITLSAGEAAQGLVVNDNYTLSGGSLTLPAGATISVAAGKTATITSALDVGTWTKSSDGTLACRTSSLTR